MSKSAFSSSETSGRTHSQQTAEGSKYHSLHALLLLSLGCCPGFDRPQHHLRRVWMQWSPHCFHLWPWSHLGLSHCSEENSHASSLHGFYVVWGFSAWAAEIKAVDPRRLSPSSHPTTKWDGGPVSSDSSTEGCSGWVSYSSEVISSWEQLLTTLPEPL